MPGLGGIQLLGLMWSKVRRKPHSAAEFPYFLLLVNIASFFEGGIASLTSHHRQC
jgi:hypothetical protein